MSNDECQIGKNGCFPLQEQSKEIISINLRIEDLMKKITDSCTTVSELKSLLWKGILLITVIVSLLQGAIQVVLQIIK